MFNITYLTKKALKNKVTGGGGGGSGVVGGDRERRKKIKHQSLL